MRVFNLFAFYFLAIFYLYINTIHAELFETSSRTTKWGAPTKIPPEQCENLGKFIKVCLDTGYSVDDTLNFLRKKLIREDENKNKKYLTSNEKKCKIVVLQQEIIDLQKEIALLEME